MSSGPGTAIKRPELGDIRPVPAPDEVSRAPDSLTQSWEEAQEREAGRLRLRGEVEILVLRSRYAAGLHLLLWLWFLIVGAALLLDGYGILDIEPSVMIAALTTTSVNVIGLVAIVARYLFPRQ